MQLYANMPMKSQLEDQFETCEMAIAAEDLDKTMAMYMIKTLHIEYHADPSF